MESDKYKKYLGIALGTFFGAITLASIYQLLSNNFGWYNPIVSPMIWILQDIVCFISMFVITVNKVINANKMTKYGSGILAFLYALFTINISLSYANTNILSFLGIYGNIILVCVELACASLLFISIKTWLPIRILGIIYWLPCLCSEFYLSKLKYASELAEHTSDWSLFEKIWSAAQTCEYFSLAISILTIICIVIWLNKKPIAPSMRNQTIDAI